MKTDVFIKEMYKKYISYEKERLDNDEIDMIKLKYVYPSIIEEIFGDFDRYPDTNGADVDYWAKNSEYNIFGSMYLGTCEITKRGKEEE